MACQPPAGYNLIASVDKYYKALTDRVTWYEARDACSSKGTILVELRTLKEYQAIRPIYGNMMIKFNNFVPPTVFSFKNMY